MADETKLLDTEVETTECEEVTVFDLLPETESGDDKSGIGLKEVALGAGLVGVGVYAGIKIKKAIDKHKAKKAGDATDEEPKKAGVIKRFFQKKTDQVEKIIDGEATEVDDDDVAEKPKKKAAAKKKTNDVEE